MPDPSFFKTPEPIKLGALAELTNSELSAPEQSDTIIKDVLPLDKAGDQDLSFFDNAKYIEQFKGTKAAACFVHPDYADKAPDGVVLLISKSPYKAYALAAQHLYPEEILESGICDTAVVDSSAKIGASCVIESGAVIKAGAVIGDYSRIESGAVIERNVKIGERCWIGANSYVTHAILGDHVRLYPGVRVGQDGFGFAIDPSGHVKVPQLGRVLIEDHVEIGANTCIDRGAGPDTVIGQGTWVDNLVQIGHNVKIGKGCVIVSQVGISGSTVLDDFVALGGQVGLAGHLHIGMGAQVAAQSGVMRNIPPGETQMGSPAMPQKTFFRQVAALNRLIKGQKNNK